MSLSEPANLGRAGIQKIVCEPTPEQEETCAAIAKSVPGRMVLVTDKPSDYEVPYQKGGQTFADDDVAVVMFVHCPGYRSNEDVYVHHDGRRGYLIVWVVNALGKIRMTRYHCGTRTYQAWNIKVHTRSRSRMWKLTHHKYIALEKSPYPTLWMTANHKPASSLHYVTMANSLPNEYKRHGGYRPFEGRKPSPHVSSLTAMECDLARYACGDPIRGFSLINLHVNYK